MIVAAEIQIIPAYIPSMVPWRNSRKPRQRSALAPAAFVDPCLPSRADKAPSADGWIHEIKHDGFRLRIHVRSARARYGSPRE